MKLELKQSLKRCTVNSLARQGEGEILLPIKYIGRCVIMLLEAFKAVQKVAKQREKAHKKAIKELERIQAEYKAKTRKNNLINY